MQARLRAWRVGAKRVAGFPIATRSRAHSHPKAALSKDSVAESSDTARKGSESVATESTVSSTSGARVKAADRKNPESRAEAAGQGGPREGSTMWAAIEVLRDKGKPMRAAEIYAEIRERKLAPGLKGKTPEQTVAAQLAVHAKRGVYVERPEPGKFQLRSE
jgi:HB1, ASXL, restriction endonuclease HTH domain